jgi:chromosome segregation ATPase
MNRDQLFRAAERAEKQIKSASRLPGSGTFRRDWFKHGVEDTTGAREALTQLAKQERKANRRIKRATTAIERLENFEETVEQLDTSTLELPPEHQTLEEQAASLEKAALALEPQLAAALTEHEEALAPLEATRQQLGEQLANANGEHEDLERQLRAARKAVGRLQEQHAELTGQIERVLPIVEHLRQRVISFR